MTRNLLTILLLSFSIFVHAQLDEIDSVKKHLSAFKEKDLVYELNKIANLYLTITPDSSIKYLNIAYSISEEINFDEGRANSGLLMAKALNEKKEFADAISKLNIITGIYDELKDNSGIANCYYEKSLSYYNLGDKDSSLSNVNKALEIFEIENLKSEIASAERLRGLIYWSVGKYGEALIYVDRSVLLFRELNDSLKISTVLNTQGAILWGLANYEDALDCYFEALYIEENFGKRNDKIIVYYNNIGMVYNDWGYKPEAFEYFTKAEELINESKHESGIAYTWLNLGTYYLETGEISRALDLLRKSQKGYADLYDVNGVSFCKIRIAQCYILQNEYQRAESQLLDAIEDTKISKNLHRRALAYFHLSRNNLIQNNLQKALQYANSGIELSSNENYKDLLHLLYTENSEIYERLGDKNNALINLKKALVEKDELFREKMAVQYEIMDLAHKNTQKEFENKQLISQNNQREKIIIYGAIFMVVVFILLFAISVNSYKLSKKKKELQQANDTKDKIFSIVAHDLRGPVGNLNAFIDLMLTNDSTIDHKKILHSFQPVIAKSYVMLENLLVWAKSNLGKLEVKTQVVSLNKSMTDTITMISNSAEKKSIDIKFDNTNDTMILADPILFQTIFRNLMNNAVKFTDENGTIQIKTDIEENFAVITIKDNGVGIPRDLQSGVFTGAKCTAGTKKEKGSGLGLMLCKDLVEKIGGRIWFKSEEAVGSAFSFSVPILKEEINQ